MGTTLRILALALLAAASPLALTATIVVLHSRLARLNGVIFAAAFVLGEAIGWAVALAVGSAVLSDGDDPIASTLEFLLGMVLLAAGWRTHRGAAEPGSSEGSARTTAALARLEHLNPVTAAFAGTVLGLGIPKRLTLTIVAAATLTTSGLGDAEQLSLVLVYMAVAAVLVWAPVAIYVVAGRRAAVWLDDGQAWLTAQRHALTVASLLAFGTILVFDGVVGLFA